MSAQPQVPTPSNRPEAKKLFSDFVSILENEEVASVIYFLAEAIQAKEKQQYRTVKLTMRAGKIKEIESLETYRTSFTSESER